MGHDHHHHDDHCAHAQDQAARAPQALAAAEECCAARGEKLTPLRRSVLEALYASLVNWPGVGQADAEAMMQNPLAPKSGGLLG